MPRKLRTDRTLYLDLELTCWEGARPEGHQSEIIQVGVAEIDTQTLVITRAASYYVRPVHSTVSDFCTTLTGITQKQVDRQGQWFPEVVATITKKFGTRNKGCFAWGDDEAAWNEACGVDGLQRTMNFFNLSYLFSTLTGVKTSLSLEDALLVLGHDFLGTPHNALDDAENTARLHVALMRRARLEGFSKIIEA